MKRRELLTAGAALTDPGGAGAARTQGRWVLQAVDNTRSPFIPVTTRLQGAGG